MMASNLLSRLLPPTTGTPSVYETLHEFDESSDASDIEERAGMALMDEENLDEGFHDYEANQTRTDTVDDRLGSRDPISKAGKGSRDPGGGMRRGTNRTKWIHRSPRILEADDVDDEVPQSLLTEGDQDGVATHQHHEGRRTQSPNSAPVPGPATTSTRAKWQATQQQQQLHQDPYVSRAPATRPFRKNQALMLIDPKEKAMWRWANVENLDNFLRDVYDYFLGNGIWCILLSRILNLLTLAFVVSFGTFLTSCIDYKKVPSSTKLDDVLVDQCTKNMSGTANLLIWLFAFLWIAKVFQYLLDIRRLRHMHDFYHHLLEISDTDIQTISWQEVVKRLMSLRDANPATASGVTERHRRFMGSQSKQRMDAHDIANRLMRRDNYLIALFNKDILDLTLPIPFFRNRQLFSKTLEWNLSLCILDYVFNEQGQVRPLFLKDTHRRALSDGLRRRFLFAGVMNVLCAPFIIVYFMMLYFFRYFNEYQRNPSQLGSRQYTPLAEWKFREFNELWHLFQRRINMSYPFASRYIDQFPKDKTIQLSRFVAFVTGALASVLALASVIDPELFLAFEITPQRTVLFYLGVFGTVWAIARGAVPEENLVFDPEYALSNVTEYTHYLPSQWRDRLHSDEVRKEFAELYQVKVIIFLEEILSIIFTPFVLWFSLPKCSDRLIDFFREFTIHVDGLGYVCSFAVFDFKKGGSNLTQEQQRRGDNNQDLRDEYYSTKDGKMLASYYGFIDNYVTNPRPGVPYLHPSTKRQFYPPPTFPGLMSPTLAPEMPGPSKGRYDKSDRSLRNTTRQPRPVATSGLSPLRRTPHFAPSGGQPSPINSILLDPQHQPSSSSFRTGHRLGTHSRLRAPRKPRTGPIEDDEEAQMEHDGQSGGDISAGAADDNNLGESWKMTRAGALDEEEVEEGVQTVTGDKGPGVLGLVYQFSRAQTEGRGAGVNI